MLHFLSFRFLPHEFDSKKSTSKKFDFKRTASAQRQCRLDDRSATAVSSALALCILLLLAPLFCRAADSKLAIVEAGVQQSEDAPFASSAFRFLPGDYLYFTFQITGFSIQSEERNEVKKISLSYELRPEDSKGVPLAPSSSGAIQAELSPEDKNWTPKRRASFLLPSLVAAGDFHIRLTVKDLIAKTETAEDFPFHIGGIEIESAKAVTLEGLRFLRGQEDQAPLDVPAYSPGDTVYVRFEMVGFQTGQRNEYHLSYGITVLGPDGKPFVEKPKAAELADNTFYPAQYLPGELTVTTSASSLRGGYALIVTIRDLIANTSYQTRKAFSIE